MIRKPFAPILILLSCLLLGGAVCAQQANPVPVNTERDPVYLALTTANVYVDPAIGGVSTEALDQAAMQSQGNPHTPVKIAVLANLPPAYLGALDQAMAQDPQLSARVRGHERAYYTFRLHEALALGKSPLILVAEKGRDDGVTVWTTALDAQERKRLADQYAPAIAANPAQGTADLAQAVASDINGRDYRSSAGLWVVFLVVVLAVGALIVAAMRRKRQMLSAARGPIQAQRDHVLSGIEYLDGYMDVLPKNNPDSDQVRVFRQSASAKYEQAVKIMDRATEATDLSRAQALFDQAEADVEQGRRYQDRATGGTGNIPGDDAVRPQPLPDTQPAVAAIPANQRGVSFFSGRPAPLGALVPVTITVGGQSRQVLVTPDEANELRQGRMPQVLAFQQGGQYVPWYDYNGYDPYNDYWRYQNSGWGGGGAGVVAGFVGAELLGGMLMPAYGMGYSPYAYATDMPMYQGYSDPGYAQPGYDAGGNLGGDTSGGDAGGGGDFFNNGGDFDTQGFDDAGGGNFMDSGGGFDSGGSDFGGGGDFGGGDSS